MAPAEASFALEMHAVLAAHRQRPPVLERVVHREEPGQGEGQGPDQYGYLPVLMRSDDFGAC